MVRYACVGVNHFTFAPNQPAIQCFHTNPGAVRLRCESERTSVRSSSSRLFGRNRLPLSRKAHYGNYCLINGNSKISSTFSDRRVEMSRGSTWSKISKQNTQKNACVMHLTHSAPGLVMRDINDIRYKRYKMAYDRGFNSIAYRDNAC